jgi:ABC-type amino acid transport system permease subunit
MNDKFQYIKLPTLSQGTFYTIVSSVNCHTIGSLVGTMSGVINIHYGNVFKTVEYINIDIFQSLSLYD